MSFAKVYSAQPAIRPAIIDVEVDLAKGLHAFSIVGLPTKAVEESQDRIAAAIKNLGFTSPKQKNQKTVVSLAPASLKKEGAVFDLAIAVGYLLAINKLKFDPKKSLFLGELALDGTLRPVNGVLSIVQAAKQQGFKEIFVPMANSKEAALVKEVTVRPAEHLKEVAAHLASDKQLEENLFLPRSKISAAPATEFPAESDSDFSVDLSEIRGQFQAKRALEIAAAGNHHLSLFGPPGTGKTMLARAFQGLLPSLSEDEAFEITAIHSLVGQLGSEVLLTRPPLRSPHHSSSHIAITGGGVNPKPGEITLAHKGVLFLDEFPEFDRRIIEALRQPIEERRIHVARAKESVSFPAHFTLIAAMNPCPCGYFNTEARQCLCQPHDIIRYRKKISGPIADRIDLWSQVGSIKPEELSLNSQPDGEPSAKVRERVQAARERQSTRFRSEPIHTNSEMTNKQLARYAGLTDQAQTTLNQVMAKMELSARSYHRIIKVARSIADLAGQDRIEQNDILEAVQYRPQQESPI